MIEHRSFVLAFALGLAAVACQGPVVVPQGGGAQAGAEEPAPTLPAPDGGATPPASMGPRPTGCAAVACPKACRTPTDCAPRQECNAGFCANPLPSLKTYELCQLDVDCPAGDHCASGVCFHECVRSADCTQGRVCDSRGRCQAKMEEAGLPPPPDPPSASSPALVVSKRVIELQDPTKGATFDIKNEGGGALDFRLVSDKDWLDAQPASGRILGGRALAVSLKASAAAAGAGDGTLMVVSNAGTERLDLKMPVTLAGLFSGELRIDSPTMLGPRALVVHLSEEGGGRISGVIDGARSPAFPVSAPAAPGSRIANDKVELSFVIAAPPGDAANPFFAKPLRRTLRVSGTFSKNGRLTGQFEEKIEGAFPQPLVLKGPIELQRVGSAANRPAPDVREAALSEPSNPTGACDVCPGGTPCPGSDLEAGRAFLDEGLGFLERQPEDVYGAIAACLDSPGGCINRQALHCAQVRFARALTTSPRVACNLGAHVVPDCARRGLLDAVRGLADWHRLAGAELLVRANRLDGSLPQRQRDFESAASNFRQALRPDDANTRGLAYFDPFVLRFLATLPDAYLASPQDTLTRKSFDPASADPRAERALPPFGDLLPMAAILAHRFSAIASEIGAAHRLVGVAAPDLRIRARLAASEAHVALTLAAGLQARPGAAAAIDLTEAVTRGMALFEKANQIAAGTNPVGLSDEYIEYTYGPRNKKGSNNFEAQAEDFSQVLARLNGAAMAAQQTKNSYDREKSAFAQEVFQQDQGYQRRLAQICGGAGVTPADLERCGESGGELRTAILDAEGAAKKGLQAIGAVDNVFEQIQIETQRAARAAGLHTAQAQLIYANGQRIQDLNDEAERSQRELADARGFFGSLSGIFNGGVAGGTTGGQAGGVYGAIIGAIAGAGLGGLSAYKGAEAERKAADIGLRIEREKEAIARTESARVELNVAKEIKIESEARIKSWMLEVPTLRINVYLTEIEAMKAASRINDLVREAVELRAARGRTQKIAKLDPRADPSYRITRDAATAAFQGTLEEAQRRLFILTRSLEYELNISYAARGRIFSLENHQQVDAFFSQLKEVYQQDLGRYGTWQERFETLSLRDHIFRTRPLEDAGTGVVYDAAEHFRRVLADPRNRDAAGNLRLSFALSLAPDEAVFNPRFCSDRITSFAASLVGADLGAIQPEIILEQKGVGLLRSCGERKGGDYLVREYNLDNALGRRQVVIQAGVNLTMPSAMLANRELYGRPIAARYELTIDRRDPANAKLDLTKLDDIVLFLSHESRTVQ